MAARMSVEAPMWGALRAYRVVALGYAVAQCALAWHGMSRPAVAAGYLAALAVWTAATVPLTGSAARCGRVFLAADLAMALAGIGLTPVAEPPARVAAGVTTLPSIWTAGAVLAFALKGGWRWAAVAAALVGAADLAESGAPTRGTVHSVLLVCIAAIAIGYVVEVARASERTLAAALRLDAATRERERLARDIHDGVLQVLAMVRRRGAEAGGEAAELGRLAGEQEVALRALIAVGATSPPVPGLVAPGLVLPGLIDGVSAETLAAAAPDAPDGSGADPGPPADLGPALAALESDRVTVAVPATPVPLAPAAAREVVAAVRAALDNVRRHVGDSARAWILLEDDPDEVLVTVRDDGPGIPAGRLADAEREGRLGVAQSIRGRLRDLGGGAEWVSVPGQGTEVELRLPKSAAVRGEGTRT
jgi:signal transduction histidine kinase